VRTLLHWSCASFLSDSAPSSYPESWPCTSFPRLDSSLSLHLSSYHAEALSSLRKALSQILETIDGGLLYSLLCPHLYALSRLIVYPSYNQSTPLSRKLRANPHTDPAFLTLIAASDSSGLELYSNQNRWCPPPVTNKLSLFLVGEWLKYFYPDHFLPQIHRVTFQDSLQPRTSLQTFLLANPYSLFSSGATSSFGDLPFSRIINSYLKKYVNYVPASRWEKIRDL
jgi:isopenicillin N synthase-like dioxygenase